MAVHRKSWSNPALLLATAPFLLVLVALFFVPLAMTIGLSFQSTQYYRVVWTWNLDTWRDVMSGLHYWRIMGRTIVMALLTTATCIGLGFPIAYAMLTRARAYDNQIKILIIFAFLTDAVLKSLGWVLFLDRSGGLNWLLSLAGFGPQSTNILFSPFATYLGMVYNLLPYTIFTIYISIDRMDRDLVLAAYDAGATKIRAFREVTLPLCRPGIYAGGILVFVLSLGVFLEPKVLGGGTSPMAAELIRQSFETRVNWPLGAALTLVVIVIAALSLGLFSIFAARGLKPEAQG